MGPRRKKLTTAAPSRRPSTISSTSPPRPRGRAVLTAAETGAFALGRGLGGAGLGNANADQAALSSSATVSAPLAGGAVGATPRSM
jgi:hypothetical protein